MCIEPGEAFQCCLSNVICIIKVWLHLIVVLSVLWSELVSCLITLFTCTCQTDLNVHVLCLCVWYGFFSITFMILALCLQSVFFLWRFNILYEFSFCTPSVDKLSSLLFIHSSHYPFFIRYKQRRPQKSVSVCCVSRSEVSPDFTKVLQFLRECQHRSPPSLALIVYFSSISSENCNKQACQSSSCRRRQYVFFCGLPLEVNGIWSRWHSPGCYDLSSRHS